MPQTQNLFLGSLAPAITEQLLPHLKQFEMRRGEILFQAGDEIKQVYFPHNGAVSLVVEMHDGQMIESAMIGRDSIVGGSAALDGRIALSKAIVQLPGLRRSSMFRRYAASRAHMKIFACC